MTSDLSILASRLREFIRFSSEEREAESSALQEEIAGNPAAAAQLRHHADVEFNGLALVLFARQFDHNAPYRKFCEARKVTPDNIAHWTEIPAMPTSAFKELELTCLPPAQRTAVFHSSGTTEQRPSRHFHSAESLELYEASLWPWLRHHLLGHVTPDTWHVTLLTPPPSAAPHSSLVHMFETVRRRLEAPESVFLGGLANDGSWTLDCDRALARFRVVMEARRPLLLFGAAFNFVHLVDHLAERNVRFQLPAGSRVLETGGYKGRSRSLPKAELHGLIADRLGVPTDQILCEYGMSELSSQAYEVRQEGEVTRFRFPAWARAQVISTETGKEVADGDTGLLRVFDLANVFSVMAIQTEDLAVRCGDGFQLIGRAAQSEPRGCSLMAP